MSKTKRIDVRLSRDVVAKLDDMASLGMLGETRDEVNAHILRQQLHDHYMRQIAIEREVLAARLRVMKAAKP